MDEKEKAKENDREEHDGAAEITDIGGFRLRCMTVVGQVEGHYLLPENQKVTKYEHGGDVEAGLAISELIASMTKPTVSLVLGGGHSIGVPLAVAAKKSFIVPSATMTLHPVRINGLVLGVPQSFEYMRKMQDRIIGFTVRNSRIDEKTLRQLIMQTDELASDTGTIIDGREAVEYGLIDGIGGLSTALRALRSMKNGGNSDG